ncbi:hypothetical protein DVH24_017388 [Malus domestica]|uniref:non-specific serine/threonine protein kinase n=1 Tax=Malus domestica TaxID=3750 RepID=A0A498IVN9_MALDO|nr:hypothetical protein DVH24_017388 [Malus domestica]
MLMMQQQQLAGKLFVCFLVALSCFPLPGLAQPPELPQEEVDALLQIATTMGAKYWSFEAAAGACRIDMVGVTEKQPKGSQKNVDCVCNFENNTVCHVVKLMIKGYSLPGMLPPQLVRLPYLQEIDFSYNYLNGTIPREWASMKLTYISVLANRLSGKVPKELGNITTLTFLNLEANQFSGILPAELGHLVYILQSADWKLATDVFRAKKYKIRMNDNNFNGPLPDWVQNWKQLKRLEMHSSGLEGPIPSNISLLNNLTELRISDTNAPSQEFPTLRYMTGLVTLILRNCNISGEIPAYIWSMKNLEMLDLSFNKLVGKLPSTIGVEHLKFESKSELVSELFKGGQLCMHINCGGSDVIVKDKNHRNVTFEGDGGAEGGSAKYFRNEKSMWGFSSTGDFMDDSEPQNTRYSISLVSSNLSELYTTARLSPLSLTYFHYCLENGIYTITLHFAEIMFTNEERYSSLGRRIFDVYVQERLVWKDFNIEYEAGMAHKRLVKKVSNVNVTSNVLEIRFYWAGKGTMVIPEKGNYGPLISAISVVSDIVGRDMQTRTFTLEQIKADSNNFDSANKIGEGGFGPVYKGQLPDGSLIAIKQLSSNSRQGNREFVNEMGLISCLQHPNIVKLHGYCIEEDHLLLAYELQQTGNLKELIDESLGNEVNDKEAEVMVNVILLCTNVSPSLRPTMSEVVSMLEGQTQVPDIIPDASTYAEDLTFKSMRDVHHQSQTHSSSGRQSQNSATVSTFCSNLEGNQFSGLLPAELGNLVNFQTLMPSSNQLTGYLPETFSELRILRDFFSLLRFSESVVPQDESARRSSVANVKLGDGNKLDVLDLLEGYSLPGILPPQLVKLPYLKKIDFALNYLNGTIPKEWGVTQLTSISLLVNRLSGEIPKELGNITTLTYLHLEANQFSGVVPPELGSLINLGTMMLSSNRLTGNLPTTFSGLRNLTDFRINDNNFNGTIPDFIQNWKQLERLVLRNCNISGEIPPYVWTMQNLEMFDVSFNKLAGEIPASLNLERLRFLFLTGNSMSGSVPDSVFKDGSNIDLSYNNFTWQGPEEPACQENLNLNLNLFRSSSRENNLCPYVHGVHSMLIYIFPLNYGRRRDSTCLHVNCGGNDITVKGDKGDIVYEGDGGVEGGSAEYFLNDNSYWGFSSTGDFMDDNDFQNTRYSVSLSSSNLSGLYTTARISPISITYFHYCLENGNYTVSLHFAEIQFTNDQTYTSLGRRIFDIYVQDKVLQKDFNIEDEAKMAQKPVVLQEHNVSVTNNILEIRFYFAGKGTTRIPERGVYGPLISAISVESDSRDCSSGGKKGTTHIVAGVIVGAFLLVFVILGILWWKGYLACKRGRKKDRDGLDGQTGGFTLKQLKAATNDFDYDNKIGEGGFGPVYKGQLPDGRVIAVKQLSSKSRQGNREFLNEMGMISCLQHPNLVKLHGCCIEGGQLLLVYEYMENNNLARALFGRENHLKLDWPTRLKICIGIARGLAFLHEESVLKIVHRDIKATNVLLDEDLNPKISDFGLAKLDEEEKTHISTRVAGTIGYMAPEYALWGHLTYKADVYSFGVVALEIISGKNNNNYIPNDNWVCLLDWACHLQQTGNLLELIDERLGSEVDQKEAEIMVKVALLCTNASASLRPSMSEVVSMLEGQIPVPDVIPKPSTYKEDLRFKAMRDLHRQRGDHSSSTAHTQNSTTKMARFLIMLTLIFCFSSSSTVKIEAQSQSDPKEVETLKEIAKQIGKKDWNFSIDPCINDTNWATPKSANLPHYNNTVICNCSTPDGFCHVVSIFLMGQDLAGVVPPSIAKLPYLKKVDFSQNYLSGTIPREWASTKLEVLSINVNNLSGPIPGYLGYITSLKYMNLQNNMLSGTVPHELGKLVNLNNLILNENYLTGELPGSLTKLTELTELRISSNSFTGKIPDYFQSWKHLQKLEIQASGFQGPIPSSISVLSNLKELRISDIKSGGSKFPPLSRMTNMQRLMLRRCNLYGPIPAYMAALTNLKILDLSFNRLEGNIPDMAALSNLQWIYLTSNLLTGSIPDWIKLKNTRTPPSQLLVENSCENSFLLVNMLSTFHCFHSPESPLIFFWT